MNIHKLKSSEVVGWKGYLVVDPETDNYTYSNIFFKKSEAEKKLKDLDISGLRVLEVDVYPSAAITHHSEQVKREAVEAEREKHLKMYRKLHDTARREAKTAPLGGRNTWRDYADGIKEIIEALTQPNNPK